MLLGELLVEHGLATVAEIATALQRQKDSGGHLGAHLIGMGVLTTTELYEVLKTQKEARTSLEFCEHLVARWEAQLGAHHPTTCEMRCKLALALMTNGRPDEALKVGQSTYDALRAAVGTANPLTMEAARVKDMAYSAARGRAASAIARLRDITKNPQRLAG
jgi:hypothetical protein